MKDIDSNLLGFCIPTYNRDAELGQCLKSVIQEISNYNFTIYVSDNASNDNTKIVISEYKKKYNNVEYNKNTENLGLYLNILSVIKMAKTEYIWLLGDDDAIRENSVDIVIDKLKDGYDFIILNSVPCDATLKIAGSDKIISCNGDKEYPVGKSGNLLADLRKKAYHGYISSMVIKTKLLQELIPKYEDAEFILYGNIWFPTAMFYEAIIEKGGTFICEPLVLNRANLRPSEKNFWNYIYLDHIKALEYLENIGYNQHTLKKAFDADTFANMYIIINAKYSNERVNIFDNYIKSSKILPLKTKLLILGIDRAPFFILKTIRTVLWRNR
jgi:glycosyltransferase involved in cell wall biosynthesis